MAKDQPKLVEFKISTTFEDMLKNWASQAGSFDNRLPKENQEEAYIDALYMLFLEFSLIHERFDDHIFVRIFRFFRDGGFLTRVSEEAPVYERYKSLEYID